MIHYWYLSGLLVPVLVERFVVPLWMQLRRGDPVRPRDASADWPTVSVIVPAYNEADTIYEKVRNVVEHDYPVKLAVIVSDDGSTDGTRELAQRAGATVVGTGERGGKASAMRRAMAEDQSDLVVFSDASSRWEPGALTTLVGSMRRHGWLCAGGRYVAAGADGALSPYLDFESKMRTREARTGSVLGLSGGLLAFYRSALEDLPRGIVNDDLWIPLEVRRRRGKVGYEPASVVRDVSSTTDTGEFRRRARIWAGNLLIAGQLLRQGHFGLFAHLCARKLLRLLSLWSAVWLFLALPPATIVASVAVLGIAMLRVARFRRIVLAALGALYSPFFLFLGRNKLVRWRRDEQEAVNSK